METEIAGGGAACQGGDMKRKMLGTLILIALCASPAPARVLKVFKLESGHTDKNRISTPLYEAGAVDPVTVEPLASQLGAEHKVSRNLPAGGTPEFTLSPTVDLGKHLTQAIQTEGAAMGLRTASTGTVGWKVSGTLDDVFLQTRLVSFGPILFYGYMKVTLTVGHGEGEPRTVTYRLHNMYARYPGGGMGLLSAQDEYSEALANFLIDSGQEIVARLNRDFFKAPVQPGILRKAEALASAANLDDREADLRMIGLSGSREAVPILLGLLPKEKDEGNRVYVIDALANLGTADAVQPLAQRYAREDEDCRFFILKAWDYIGGEEAQGLISRNGGPDKDHACRALAGRLRVKAQA
jgi:hypothetical protein